eukprot:CAMPEP_0173099294 /NCGR_PEP_ID=MMETSP1102-20130122/35394_1 /TAXON_ID=49646 /ORGANISM="Geminigera sp., Strain Caron Lab Isolate" /LENGTH=462 /DNA_ID=CAMNT_0013992261 /DNA_START=16 /DNA_END=1404 /DNA_ORIENTATION=-
MSETFTPDEKGECAVCGEMVWSTDQRCKTLDNSAYQHMRCTQNAPEFEAKPTVATLANGQSVQVNGLKIRKAKPPPPAKPGRKKLCASAPGAQQAHVKARPDLPTQVDLRKWMTPVEYQAATNSCCANAVAGAYEYLCTRQAEKTGDTVGDISRLFVYYVGRLVDAAEWNEEHLPLQDDGMTVDGAVKALQAKGVCLEKDWDFDITKVNQKPHDDCFRAAMRYKTRDALKIKLELEAMKTCLADGFPIIFGLKLTARFMDPGTSGYVATPSAEDKESDSHGAHALLLVGYDDAQRVFIVRNSWGDWWGDKGYCYASYDYIASPDFNLEMHVGMYAIRGLDDYDFTPEDGPGTPLYDSEVAAEWTQSEVVFENKASEVPAAESSISESTGDMFDPLAEARRVFEEMDHDKSGKLDTKELGMAYRLQGVYITNEQLQQVVSAYDTDKDGKINFQEYCTMVGIST